MKQWTRGNTALYSPSAVAEVSCERELWGRSLHCTALHCTAPPQRAVGSWQTYSGNRCAAKMRWADRSGSPGGSLYVKVWSWLCALSSVDVSLKSLKRHGFLMQFFGSWSVAYNSFWSYSGKLTNFNFVQRKSWRNSKRELHLHRIQNTTFWAAAILLWRSPPWPGKLKSLTVSQDWLLRHGVWANLKQSS